MLIGTPHTKGAGYLMARENLNVSQRHEADVRTCTHCQKVIEMQQWKRNGAWCPQCYAPVCHACGKKMQTHGCEPFLKKVEAQMRLEMRFDSFDLLSRLAAGQPSGPFNPA